MAGAPWTFRLALASAVAAVIVLLVLPLPHTTMPVPTRSGPLTLAAAFPTARMVDLPAALPDGSLVPMAVLDPTTVLGLLTSSVAARSSLVVLRVTEPDRPRVLASVRTTEGSSINAVAAAGRSVFWIVSRPDSQGRTHNALYRADRDSGPARLLTEDTGDAIFNGSQHDLQVADGRVHWIATHSLTPLTTERRSIGVDGGPVTVQPLDGAYGLSAWPWLVTFATNLGEPITLRNLATGQVRTVAPAAGGDVSCSPAWCRTITSTGGKVVITLDHPDGRAKVRVNADGETSVIVDVAVADRFELLGAPAGGVVGGTSRRLAVYDLKTHRRVLLGVATGQGVHGWWLWWSTGVQETLTWHLLDLTTLP